MLHLTLILCMGPIILLVLVLLFCYLFYESYLTISFIIFNGATQQKCYNNVQHFFCNATEYNHSSVKASLVELVKKNPFHHAENECT